MPDPSIETYIAERRALLDAMSAPPWRTYRSANGVARILPAADGPAWDTMFDNPNNDADNTGLVAIRNDEERQLAVIEQCSWALAHLDLGEPVYNKLMLRSALDALLTESDINPPPGSEFVEGCQLAKRAPQSGCATCKGGPCVAL